jgi:putative heme-binding domain-containing protein
MTRDAQFVFLVQRFQLKDFAADLRQVALAQADESLGIEAVSALLDLAPQLLREALQSDELEQSLAAARALGNAADDRGQQMLLETMHDEFRPIELRRRAAWAVCQTVHGAKALIEMAQRGELPEPLKQAVGGALHASDSEDIRHQAAELFPLPPSKDDQPLPSLEQLLSMSGDIDRGKTLYTTTGQCANCHQVGSTGKEVGPALSEIGSKLSKQALFESILFPSAGISHNYETYILELDSGNIVTGVLVSKTDQEVIIKTDDALLRRFTAGEVATLQKSDVSLMPADLQKQLSAQDLVDVVEYLTTLRSP